MDPFDQVVQALSKLPRPLVNCATLIVVSELLMITSSLASLEGGREREREIEREQSISPKRCADVHTFPVQL